MEAVNIDFRMLFESSPDILLVLLPDAPRFTMVAATEARLAATHTTRETLGRGLFELFPDNPDDPEATGTSNLRASLERVLATRAADTMAVQKYDIRGPDGTFQSRYWSPKNIPVITPTGDIRYILHRVEDVTDLVQASELGQELRDRTRQMEREVISRSRELADANRNLRDANVKGNRFKVWPMGNSDHRALSVWYDVNFSVTQPTSVGGGGDETDAEDAGSGDPDFYATGGNIDYSDYMDDTTYELVRVVEDSDLLRS